MTREAKRYFALGIPLLLLWLAFILFAPQGLIYLVLCGVAGWQVGTWIAKTSTKWAEKE